MLEFLDFEDRYAVKGARLVVEASRLPPPVREAFREWVLMGLLMRGRGALSDYFFDVLRLNGLEGDDIEDESLVFGTFLGHEFYRFLRTEEGAPYAAPFLAKEAPAPAAPEPVRPRVPSPIGPSLPPELAASLRAAGHTLSCWEDAEDAVWVRPEPPAPAPAPLAPVVPDEADAPEEGYHTPSAWPKLGDHAPEHFGSGVDRIVEGVDWGDPKGAFRRATWVALCSGDFPGVPRGIRLRFDGSADGRFRGWVFKGGDPVPPVPPAAPPPERGRGPVDPASALFGENSEGGEGRCGLTALVADDQRHAAISALGLEPELKAALAWIFAAPGRAYGGKVKIAATFRATGRGPYPDRWFVWRGDNGAVSVDSLRGEWRGRDAPLDFRMRYGF